eukprot:gnl/TRDRNA2_/TRDRNA2_193857_c0_seq1.p1 gnl/TRDRNA2_/TRDRNA2_193857_c0~~gnl/TRDRNA2_/TRDRNA2_193857_c0_seq1.p1  ORF type:complete len:212 (+),score=12.84 gnl/TRDRNA2_/TRDRNA2_193857_c0_seq1:81-716(+)
MSSRHDIHRLMMVIAVSWMPALAEHHGPVDESVLLQVNIQNMHSNGDQAYSDMQTTSGNTAATESDKELGEASSDPNRGPPGPRGPRGPPGPPGPPGKDAKGPAQQVEEKDDATAKAVGSLHDYMIGYDEWSDGLFHQNQGSADDMDSNILQEILQLCLQIAASSDVEPTEDFILSTIQLCSVIIDRLNMDLNVNSIVTVLRELAMQLGIS